MTVHLGEDNAQGDFLDVYKYLMGGIKKMELDSPQQCPVIRQEAMGTN